MGKRYIQTVGGNSIEVDEDDAVLRPPLTSEQISEVKNQIVAEAFRNSLRDRAIGELLWQVAKAAKTNNWTFFDNSNEGTGVNNRDDFINVYREILDQIA